MNKDTDLIERLSPSAMDQIMLYLAFIAMRTSAIDMEPFWMRQPRQLNVRST